MKNVNEFLKKCTIVKNTTKKAFHMIDNYSYALSHYGCRTLSDCYSDYSGFKVRAFEAICKECVENGGYSMTIPSYNSMSFTQAYIMTVDGIEWLIYHTRDNRFAIELPDELQGCVG